MRRIPVLWSYPTTLALRRAISDHLHALDGGPERIAYHNAFSDVPRLVRGLEFDGVVLHTTRRTRARHVYERVGFRVEGMLREAARVEDACVNVVLMAVLRSDYDSRR